MERYFDVELNEIKKKVLLMGGSVESQLQDVLEALTERNVDLAVRVVENDMLINMLDLEIDEACLGLLALHHPTAGDLRFITTAMKISTELERMSDLAENIDIGFELRFFVQLDHPFGDVFCQIAHSFEFRGDLHGRRNKSEIAGCRVVERQEAETRLVDFEEIGRAHV